MKYDYITIVNITRPDIKISTKGSHYEDINWHDSVDIPTKEELESLIDEYNQKELNALFRIERNYRLEECDWLIINFIEKGEELPIEWKEYRQKLRDITENETPRFNDENSLLNIDSINWPERPFYIRRKSILFEDEDSLLLSDTDYLLLENCAPFDNNNSQPYYKKNNKSKFPVGTLK